MMPALFFFLNSSRRGGIFQLISLLSSAMVVTSFSSKSTMMTFASRTNRLTSMVTYHWSSTGSPVSLSNARMSSSRVLMVTSVGGGGAGGGLFGEQGTVDDREAFRRIQKELPETAQWQVFVDQSKSALDRGGGATLDAFCCLAPPSTAQVVPAILPGGNKKFPWVRCISKIPGRSNIEVGNVDSVDKVYRVLTKHLQIKDVNYQVREALKWKYEGNSLLEDGNTKGAISAYNEALKLLRYTSSSSSSSSSSSMESKQVGTVLLLRSSAYSQQAQFHRDELQRSVDEWDQPSTTDLQVMISLASGMTTHTKEQQLNNSSNRRKNKKQQQREKKKKKKIWDHASIRPDVENSYSDDNSSVVDNNSSNTESSEPNIKGKDGHDDKDVSEDDNNDSPGGSSLSIALLGKLSDNGAVQKRELRKIRYLHGLYQNSLLQAVQDSLKATEILPTYSTAWLRSAQLLSDLWKLNESRQYYEKAMTLDDNRSNNNNNNENDNTDDNDDRMIMGSILKDLDEQQAVLDWARKVDGWPEDSVRLALDLSG
mmetsp:Transcript_35201/g.85213  ORF Transcript_35201/g.85213 Transcript_35201/m.85213 type:complete len:540 (+) Transcript_35201:285-1904(+)